VLDPVDSKLISAKTHAKSVIGASNAGHSNQNWIHAPEKDLIFTCHISSLICWNAQCWKMPCHYHIIALWQKVQS